MPRADGPDDGSGPGRHWFEPLADHLGAAYLRYSFTRGTRREVDAIVELCGLAPGDRVLDVGCGPGRHAHELGRRGIRVDGIDVSETFVAVAAAAGVAGVRVARLDARLLSPAALAAVGLGAAGGYDAVISVCQGAFGLQGGPADDGSPLGGDVEILRRCAAVLRPGGRLVVTAFNAYLQVRALTGESEFDADRGVHRERTVIRSPDGAEREVDLWTSCFTPRELRLAVGLAGLELVEVRSVEPGRWGPRPPDVTSPEFLVLARRPRRDTGATSSLVDD